MTMRIQLRSKHDHSIVLPEASVYSVESYGWLLEFHEDEIDYIEFRKEDWEPVPPPFTLPKGAGAALRHNGNGHVYVRVSDNVWYDNASNFKFRNSDFELAAKRGDLQILSEGVVV